ncbi:MAG TPA: preprotein translocase subunit SecE [Candidatus Saccharimonadales bacterium]|nr:preprotein translocase subunit SecE [Candidatus Saccharimonadales bacterium]
MAKKATKKEEEKKPALVKKVLTKRVDVAKEGKLAQDVKMPRWLRAIGGYFKGSWRELREVRWPTRRATLSLTMAVITFTVVLTVMILALDYGFEQLFKQVIL